MPRSRLLASLMLLALVSAAIGYVFLKRSRVPRPGSETYEQTVQAFYTGVAALQVGLLDDAGRNFDTATKLAPSEPATWGNLAVTRLRLADLDGAEMPMREALRLAEDAPAVQMLAARVESARGRLDEGLAHLRRAVMLDPRSLRSRFALVEQLEQTGNADGATEALSILGDLARDAPKNAAILLERARLASSRGDHASVTASVVQLMPLTSGWSALARDQFQELATAAGGDDTARLTRAVLLLRNALAREPSFAADLSAIRTPTENIAEAFESFLEMEPPQSAPASPDSALTFSTQDLPGGTATAVAAVSLDGAQPPVVFAANATSIWRTDRPAEQWPFPGSAASPAGTASLLPIDWNNDFATDLIAAGSGGVRLYLQAGGTFVDRTAEASVAGAISCSCRGAWSADIEMDGDLDVVLGVRNDGTQVLRNNGDGTWTTVTVFSAVQDARGFAWADVDADGDPDAVFLAGASVRVFLNNRAGAFSETPFPTGSDVAAMMVADLDADGSFDVMTLQMDGSLRRNALDNRRMWVTATVRQGGPPTTASTTLFAADVDNNGALDVVRSGDRTDVWLADEHFALQPLSASIDVSTAQVVDLDNDGRLELLGVRGGARVAKSRGEKPYHWKQVRVRAQATAGDQRINSFAVGGEIEVRAGLLRQRQLLNGTPAHFGLGPRTNIDVTRILWPNGAPQVEFASAADTEITAEQRLKGSCPWVFAWDGSEMRFVTDFIWRSPLGLRINAQDTAGVSQTEDWVRIRGDQLKPRDGRYDVRITAELWETHFFDHVSLMVVDHPKTTEVFVDERFTPAPVNFAAHAVRDLRPVGRAIDEQGTDVTGLVAARDGRHLDTFARGYYQGIASDHAVTADLPARSAEQLPGQGERLVLVAQGWVYPTDSSINVAVGQGHRQPPHSLILEYQTRDGRWTVAARDLGFPAGKNKTMLIDLSGIHNATRIRLSTNMEVYWDALATGIVTSHEPLRTTRLPAMTADLRYRGFSRTSSLRASTPETPTYAPIGAVGQRWRDLVGYYTRFGDVQELIQQVDDRYVIMNAGDELAMTFAAPVPPPAGWTRDFVLVGDGWEKDGDFNTEYSATVLPLPSHAPPHKGASGAKADVMLEDDPVYRAHADDWARYHTRHVRPDDFWRGLDLPHARTQDSASQRTRQRGEQQ